MKNYLIANNTALNTSIVIEKAGTQAQESLNEYTGFTLFRTHELKKHNADCNITNNLLR